MEKLVIKLSSAVPNDKDKLENALKERRVKNFVFNSKITDFLPLSFWQNSAKMTELKIGTKPKQSFQTTKTKLKLFLVVKQITF